jgi:sirohydrochlorin ferrochelatase
VVTSPVFGFAVSRWRGLREEFEVVRQAAYVVAEEETRGAMLNAWGRRLGIDPYSLFLGPAARAYAYASAELVEHWRTHPRPVFQVFEAARFDPDGGVW